MFPVSQGKIVALVSAGKFVEEHFRQTKKVIAAKSAAAVILQVAIQHPDLETKSVLIDIAAWIMAELLQTKKSKAEPDRVKLLAQLRS